MLIIGMLTTMVLDDLLLYHVTGCRFSVAVTRSG